MRSIQLLLFLASATLGDLATAQAPHFIYPNDGSAVEATGRIRTELTLNGVLASPTGTAPVKFWDASAASTIVSPFDVSLSNDVQFIHQRYGQGGYPGCVTQANAQILDRANDNGVQGLDYSLVGSPGMITFNAALSHNAIALVSAGGPGGTQGITVTAVANLSMNENNALRVKVPFDVSETVCLLIPSMNAFCVNRETCINPTPDPDNPFMSRGITSLRYRVWQDTGTVAGEYDSMDAQWGTGVIKKGNQLDSCVHPEKCRTPSTVIGPIPPIGAGPTHYLELTLETETDTSATSTVCDIPEFGFNNEIHETADITVLITPCPPE